MDKLTKEQKQDILNSFGKLVIEPDGKELDFLKKLNWFEKQPWGDDGRYSCFFREKGTFPLDI